MCTPINGIHVCACIDVHMNVYECVVAHYNIHLLVNHLINECHSISVQNFIDCYQEYLLLLLF